MVQTRPLYGLADLPSTGVEEFDRPSWTLGAQEQIGAASDNLTAGRFDVVPPTLATIGTSWAAGFDNGVLRYPSALIGNGRPSTRADFIGGPMQTALLQGGAVVGDAVRSSPSLGLKNGVPDRMTRLLNQPGLENQMMEATDDSNSAQFDRCWGTPMSYKNWADGWLICSYGELEELDRAPDGSRSFKSPSPIMVHNEATGEYRAFIGRTTITVTRGGKLTADSPT